MTIETIARSSMDLSAMAEAERVPAYLDAIDHSLETAFLSEPPYARLHTCYLGALRLIECFASPRRSDRLATQIARDRHDGISIQYCIAGMAAGDAAGRRVVHGPGTTMILDFGQPFSITDEEERHIVNVSIPRAVLQRYDPDLRDLHGMVIGVDDSAILAAHLQALTPRLTRLPAQGAETLGTIIIDLFLIAIGHDPAAISAPATGRGAALADRARRIVEDRLGSEDLSPEWLMSKLGVSRSDLYHVFEEHGGVARYIWRRRLESARAFLRDAHDGRRIGVIAFSLGFSSEAHFSRAYRASFGETPSETRRVRG